jgi:type IV secretion system protein VirD4
MYLLSRMLLMLAACAGLAGAGMLAVLFWPASGVVIALIFLAHMKRRRSARLTILGSARFANEDDLRYRGMVDGDRGLILGRIAPMRRTLAERIQRLFNRGLSAKEACRQFWDKGRRSPIARLPNAIHTVVFAPSGAGKGVSFVVPFLMSEPGSCVVVDFKGELASLTAEYRRKHFGQRVVLLDPFKVRTQRSPDTFNALDFIDKDSPYAIDHCNDLAKALIIRNPDEKEPHWSDSAEAFVAAITAMVVQFGERGESRSLQTVREFLSSPARLDLALKVMGESECWGGMLARLGGQLSYFVEKERSSVLTTVGRNLRFLDSLAVMESTKSSSFDPAELRSGKMAVYLILPPDHMRAQSALLRVWIGSMLRAVVAGGLQETNKVHFVLDEMASIGHLDAIDDAVDKYRGYGVRLQLYLQAMSQLKKCFPEGQDATLLANCSQVFFGVSENFTADYVSNRLGEHTVMVESSGRNSGGGSQWSESTQPSTGGSSSHGSSTNLQPQARKILKPDEVMALPPRTAITFVAGMPPIMTTLVRYYEQHRSFWKRPGRLSSTRAAVAALAGSVTLCILSLCFLAAGAEMLQKHLASSPRPVPAGSNKQGPGVPVRRAKTPTMKENNHVRQHRKENVRRRPGSRAGASEHRP